MVPVSVVVTAYNVERHIAGTVRSIRAQTLADIEIIVVNDGSTDGTRAVLEALAGGERPLRLVHRPNGGVSAARNSGLESATGEYVLFVDGDDLLLPTACELLHASAHAGDADMVVSDYLMRRESTGADVRVGGSGFTRVTGAEFARMMLVPEFPVAVWNKLVRRSLYVEHGIRFPENMSMGEDLVTMFELSCRARTVMKLDEPTLVYIKREGSLISTLSPHLLTVTVALERLERLLADNLGSSADLRDEFHTACFFHVMSARVLPGRRFGGVHRDLYNWYHGRGFGKPGPACRRFQGRLTAAERLVANGYAVSYAAGTGLRRVVDLARRASRRARGR